MTNADRMFRPDASTVPPKGEVEVARICYPDTAATGVVTVRASRLGNRIVYRVVSADGRNCFRRGPARLPLTMGQMVWLIDRSRHAVAHWYYLLRERGVRRANLPAFRVESNCYPNLSGYLADRAAAVLSYWSGPGRNRRPPSRASAVTIRNGLLVRLKWEECATGIVRTDAERDARADHFIAMRFGPYIFWH